MVGQQILRPGRLAPSLPAGRVQLGGGLGLVVEPEEVELLDLHDSNLAPKCPLQHRQQQRVPRGVVFRPPALEYFGLRAVVAFGRTVGRGRRPGSDEAAKHLPEGRIVQKMRLAVAVHLVADLLGIEGMDQKVWQKNRSIKPRRDSCGDCWLFRKRIYAERSQIYLI